MKAIAALELTITASAVAWYGAIVATCALLINGYNAWRDRPRLKIIGRPNMLATAAIFDGDEPMKTKYIIVTAANVGRGLIRPESLWFSERGQTYVRFVKYPEERKTLPPGESYTFYVNQTGIDPDQVKRIHVEDATGRVWTGTLLKGGSAR